MSEADESDAVQAQVLSALLAFSANQSDNGRAFARHMNMRPTDATAIVEILRAEERGQPLTPTRLGERISMTSGATTILLNRLEDAGHLTRIRGHSDRRIVTLHSAEAVHAEATAFFEPERMRIVELIDKLGVDDLALVHSFTAALAAAGGSDASRAAASRDVSSA